MNVNTCLPALIAVFMLGACSERSPDDTGGTAGADDEVTLADSPFTPTPVDADAPVFVTDLPDAADDTTGGTVGDTDTVVAIDDGADVDDDPPGLDPLFGQESSTPPDVTVSGPDTDPTLDTPPAATAPDDLFADETSVAPSFPGDADADRVFALLTRATGDVLLDLNARLSQGLGLSARQDACLGDHDPALGDPLLAIDCPEALATGPAGLALERAAFVASDVCRASVARGSIDGCVPSTVSAVVSTRYVAQEPPARRAEPVAGSGVVVRFGIDTGVLEIMREPDAPVADFQCGLVASTGATLPTDRGNCDIVFRDTANFLERLFSPS